MDISGKIWGQTSKIFSQNNVEVYRIVGKKGGKSSTHTHQSKLSMFFVESGSIKVVIEKNDYKLQDTTILRAEQSIIIRPQEYHYFEILEEGTIAYEIYWVVLDPDDIIRRDTGTLS